MSTRIARDFAVTTVVNAENSLYGVQYGWVIAYFQGQKWHFGNGSGEQEHRLGKGNRDELERDPRRERRKEATSSETMSKGGNGIERGRQMMMDECFLRYSDLVCVSGLPIYLTMVFARRILCCSMHIMSTCLRACPFPPPFLVHRYTSPNQESRNHAGRKGSINLASERSSRS